MSNVLSSMIHVVAPSHRVEVLCHPGHDGLRRFAREIVSYEVPERVQPSQRRGLWRGSFVAGDRVRVFVDVGAGRSVEVALLDVGLTPVELKKTSGESCTLRARVRRSGVYYVCVRDLGESGGCLPFEVTCERWLPQRPRRRRGRPCGGNSPGQQLRRLIELLGRRRRQRQRLPSPC